MNHRKYPTSLFIFGFITNILFHFFWLIIPAILLLIIGIWNDTCLVIGIGLLILDILLSFIEQMKIRQTFLSDSDDPDFQAFQEALSKDGNWMNNVQELVESKFERIE